MADPLGNDRARRFGRRTWLLATSASAASAAMGRTPLGGSLNFTLPWAVYSLDPHDLYDPCAALFGSAITDPLYALDAHGRPYPALADGMPSAAARGASVRLRPGIVTAQGRRLSISDVHWSLTRARSRAARGLLSEFGAPRLAADSVHYATADPTRLAIALASPCCAILPRSFRPEQPDGTGALAATARGGGLNLQRNPRAARGAAFLDQLSLRPAQSLSDALRAFESETTDLGWLGDGLHRRRPGAQPFTSAAVGWVVLRTGAAAGAWSAAGVAQRLLEGMAPGALSRFGLTPASAGGSTRWGGGDAEIAVDDRQPFLAEVADALAGALSQPGHQLRVARLQPAEIARRRSADTFTLMIDLVRNLSLGPNRDGLALVTAANPALADRPPKVSGASAAQLARTLPLGIIGELKPSGYFVGPWRGFPAWDFGALHLAEP